MILIASDHGGYTLKEEIKEFLISKGYELKDIGTDCEQSVDYPDFAHALCKMILSAKASRGILICGTGLGMSMSANRHQGIRAALCTNEYMAKMSRRHNDANVLCLGARVIAPELAKEIVLAFLNTSFEGGRHRKRIEKIDFSNG